MSAEEAVRAYLRGRIDRREFIKTLVALGVTAGAAISYADALASSGSRAGIHSLSQAGQITGPVALTGDDFSTLQAIAARIVPTTDTPGATEAGAAHYVDFALSNDYAPSLPRYREGLAQIDAFCVDNLGRSFASLSEDEQDAVLEDLEAGRIAEVTGGQAFFDLVRRHVLEGMFCEPIYGGNRDMVGWSLVGFPGQRFGYRDPYINRIVDLPPVAADGMPPRDI
jgi:gluconate 2-dehydrogenase gamma chain